MGCFVNFIKSLSWYNRAKLFFAVIVWAWCGTFGGLLLRLEYLPFAVLCLLAVWAPIYLIVKGRRVGYLFLLLAMGVWCVPMTVMALEYGMSVRSFLTILILLGIMGFAIIDCIRTPVVIGRDTRSTVAIATGVMCFLASALFGLFVAGVILLGGGEDYELQMYNECVQTRTAKGYPEKEVKDFCMNVSWGCSDKVYVSDCDPDVFCCLDSIEEHKKWNYLD